MVVDNKNIYHQQLTSTIIYYFSTTKYNRPLLANCVLSPIFFKKRPKNCENRTNIGTKDFPCAKTVCGSGQGRRCSNESARKFWVVRGRICAKREKTAKNTYAGREFVLS